MTPSGTPPPHCENTLVGRTLTRCDIRVPRFATVDLTGQVVDEVLSRGKHLFIRVGPASIHSHLKMDGSWRVGNRPTESGSPGCESSWKPTMSARVGVDLGVLEILDRAHDGDVVAHLGPDLLGEDWDPSVAAANLTARPDRPLAEALLDQRVLAGIGNVYCNELCFVSGHLPTAPVSAVADPVRLLTRAQHMLWSQPLPLEPLHHRRHPSQAGSCGSTGERGSCAAAAAPASSSTTPPSGWRIGVRPANAERPRHVPHVIDRRHSLRRRIRFHETG